MIRLINRACLLFLAAAVLSGCDRNELLQQARAENKMWKFEKIEKIEATISRIEFSHERHGKGIAYVKTLPTDVDDGRIRFYSWAQCFERGAALDLELTDMGWDIEDRWQIDLYCADQMERVEVNWIG